MHLMKALLIMSLTATIALAGQSGQVKPTPAPQATPEPSLAETTDWIAQNLPSKGLWAAKGERGREKREVTSRVTAVKFDGCNCDLTLTVQEETLTGVTRSRALDSTRFIFPLEMIDAAAIRAEKPAKFAEEVAPVPMMLVLMTKELKKVVRSETSGTTSGKINSMTDRVAIDFDPGETAERFAKAFTHAVKLCQKSKKEPF